MRTVSVSQMRELDRRTIEEADVPGEVLMERAGTGAGEYILDYISGLSPIHVKRFVLLAGKGNNGGDAYVVARYLYENTDIETIIYSVCPVEELTADARLNAERLPQEVSCEIRKNLSPDDFEIGDIIIDGLLGTGIKGPLRAPYDNWIASVNNTELPVIALDIPSGLNGDNGAVATDAIFADLTISMGLPKTGVFMGEGPNHCGRLQNVDIGIPAHFIDELPKEVEMIFSEDIQPLLGRVPNSSHKDSCGRLLMIGGCH